MILLSNNWKFDESVLDIITEQKSEIILPSQGKSLFRWQITGGSGFALNPQLEDLYSEISVNDEIQKTVVVIPVFTDSAYFEPGFYTYYRGECDSSCLTTEIQPEHFLEFHSSGYAVNVLRLLGYQTITDIDIDKNPDILSDYDKVIMLHSEYVTRNEFNAVTNHPHVMYLYPNALYAEIITNYENNTITLIRGHGYPEKGISNGFDWKFDNTYPFEFDTDCNQWEFYEIDNGVMLNCYPENTIPRDESLLRAIKEF